MATLPPELLPDKATVQIQSLSKQENSFQLELVSNTRGSPCPVCNEFSDKIHSYYPRSIQDLPWAGYAVRICWKARKFYCENEDCSRKVFCERLGEAVAPHGRRTRRLNRHLNEIGFALGANGGSKLASFLGMPISSSTMLRAIYHVEEDKEVPTPRYLGIDDWAFRRGHKYGTILVDLEKGKPVDLLPDRESDTLAEWLKQHPGVEIISRDRASFYKDGATRGAPQAVQVADRWHILKNVREMLQKVFEANRQALTQAAQELESQEKEKAPDPTQEANNQNVTTEHSTEKQAGQKQQTLPKTQREIDYYKVKELHAGEMKVSQIARKVGISRTTVYKYINADSFPKLGPRRSLFTPYITFLSKRLEAGMKNVDLYKEMVVQGYKGTYRSFCYGMSQHFPKHDSRLQNLEPSYLKQYTPHRSSYLMIKPEDKRPNDFKNFCKLLFETSPTVKKAMELSWQFCEIIRGRKAGEFDDWLTQAEDSKITQLVNFAAGVRKDYDAIKNACTLEWSNGQVEGQVNRLKNIKRQMYGRAGFLLLRKRVLMDSS